MAGTLHSHLRGSAFLGFLLQILDASTQFYGSAVIFLNLSDGGNVWEQGAALDGKGLSYSSWLLLLQQLRLLEHHPLLHMKHFPVFLIQFHELQIAPLRVVILGSYFCLLATVDKGTNYLCRI